jgi:hypothetical protein
MMEHCRNIFVELPNMQLTSYQRDSQIDTCCAGASISRSMKAMTTILSLVERLE